MIAEWTYSNYTIFVLNKLLYYKTKMTILTKIFPIDALNCTVEMRTPFLEDQKKIRKNNLFKHAVCGTNNNYY